MRKTMAALLFLNLTWLLLGCSSTSKIAPISASSAEQNMTRMGYVTLEEENPDKNIIFLMVHEVIWVSADDTDLIAQYGLEDAYFDDDYELVDADPAEYCISVFKDGSTSFTIVNWSNLQEEFLKKVDWTEFLQQLEQRSEQGMLVKFTGENNNITSVEEIYVP